MSEKTVDQLLVEVFNTVQKLDEDYNERKANINKVYIDDKEVVSKPYVDIQTSVIKGLNNQQLEDFLKDLREVMLKHNVTKIMSDYIAINKDRQLIVRKSNIYNENSPSLERKDKDTNIFYNYKSL